MALKEQIYSLYECTQASELLKKSHKNLLNSDPSNISTFISSYNNWFSVVHKIPGTLTDIALNIVSLCYNDMVDGLFAHWKVMEDAEDSMQSYTAIAVKIRLSYKIKEGVQVPTTAKFIAFQQSNGNWVTLE